MQTWNLTAGDPLALTLAADARATDTDYTDDQIWELSLGGGEPAALALQTTFGLRAHWMRLFPRFVRADTARSDPGSFHTPPHIVRFSASTLAVEFEPFEGIHVLAEYWACESQVVMGRIQINNHSILSQALTLEWVALLNPIDRQGGMTTAQAGATHVLTGETAYLSPVVYLTGGPQPGSGPYPALALEIELYPGGERQLTWAAASKHSMEESLEAARAATARPWEAEHARIDMLNRSQILQITTGSPDWDAAFALTQKAAQGLLLKNPLYLPHASFVLSRRPDQGFSARGGGSGSSHLWSGQTALDSYFLASLLLPGAPDVVAGLVRNFLAAQDEINGAVDWRPGLGGQRSRRLAQPLLAALAVQAAPYLPQPDWYREVFPGLLRFFNAWFDPQHDRDGDGFPEWEHPVQSGIEDSPVFERWSPGAQGIDIISLESPGLAAMLYHECQCLIEIAGQVAADEEAAAAYGRLTGEAPQLTGAAEALPALRERASALCAALDSAWDEKAAIYHYRDYQTHLSPPGQKVIEFSGSGRVAARKRFNQPRRLLVQIQAAEERTYNANVIIHGFTAEGEASETLSPRSFSWQGRQARATTLNTFVALKRIQSTGLADGDQVRITAADYTQEDCSLLLPLWAGAASPEQADRMVQQSLLGRYLRPSGIALAPPDLHPQDELPGLHSAVTSALLPWNHLLGEGLLRYGFRAQAAELVTRLMGAVVSSLKQYRNFRQLYHAETGLAGGESGHLHGLAPLGLFLQALGIRQLTAGEILLDGFNPFPWVINVQYRKVTLTFHPDRTEINFPGGHRVVIDRPGLHRVTLE